MKRYTCIVLAAFLMFGKGTAEAQNGYNVEKLNRIQELWASLNPKSVTLTPYLAEYDGKPHTAIIVCPGGSYSWHDTETEGTGVAKWLQKNGISAFVLNYRVATGFAYASHYRLLFRGNRFPDAFVDVQRAIQFVRKYAAVYSVNPNDVGVMGFSAGGHLAMASGEYFNTDYAGLGWLESRRPDFVVPVYPVVTFTDKRYMHKRSRKGLIGEWHTKEMNDSLSIEHHVKYDTPRAFIVNCVDDPIVKYQNSELLDSALTAKGIEHRYIQYKTGGHGFGASDEKGTEECRQWRGEFLEWLKSSDRAH